MKSIINAEGKSRIVLTEREEMFLHQASELCDRISGFAYKSADEWHPDDKRDANLHDVQAAAVQAGMQIDFLLMEIDGFSEMERTFDDCDPPSVEHSQPE